MTDDIRARLRRQLDIEDESRALGARRYTKRGELTPISRLEVGEDVTLVAKVAKVNARVIPKNGRRLQILTLTVGDGAISAERRARFDQWRRAFPKPLGSEGYRKIMRNHGVPEPLFGVKELVSYISRFMTLEPGDLISTGTPPGVGLGAKPNPVYLKAGDVMRLGIQGLGEQRQAVHAWSAALLED